MADYDIERREPKLVTMPPEGEAKTNGSKQHAKEDPPHAFQLQPFETIDVNAAEEWLIDEILPCEGMATIIAPSSGGKSALGIDIGLAIARGLPWAGKNVLQGPSVYLCGEGNAGFRKRIVAYRKRHNIIGHLPFYLVEGGPDLRHANSADVWKVLNAIHLASVKPRVIFVDTLQRHIHADDSKTDEMSAFCDGCTRIARDYKCLVVPFHHTPWSDVTRGRGSTVLKASVETELLIEGTEGVRTVILKKSRDGEAGLTMTFELEPVEFTAHGRQFRSIVVDVKRPWNWTIDAADSKGKKKPKPLTANQQIILDSLLEALVVHGETPSALLELPLGTKVVNRRYVAEEARRRGFYADENGEHPSFRQRLSDVVSSLVVRSYFGQRQAGCEYYLWDARP